MGWRCRRLSCNLPGQPVARAHGLMTRPNVGRQSDEPRRICPISHFMRTLKTVLARIVDETIRFSWSFACIYAPRPLGIAVIAALG